MPLVDGPTREIFVVDDDPSAREAIASLLKPAGFRVTLFADAASAIDAARATPPACIVLDLHMPGGSGLEVLTRLDADTMRRRSSWCPATAHDAIAAAAKRAAEPGTVSRPLPAFAGASSLTPREHEVLAHIVDCASNKEAATRLGISRAWSRSTARTSCTSWVRRTPSTSCGSSLAAHRMRHRAG